jgi:hypothetical protein
LLPGERPGEFFAGSCNSRLHRGSGIGIVAGSFSAKENGMSIFRKAACIVLFALLALAAAAAQDDDERSNPQQTRLADIAKALNVVGSWRGTTPCADCSGIDTTLTLYGRTSTADAGVYKMDMTYVGRNTSNSIYGRWVLLRGTPTSSHGYIYRLDPSRAGGQFYLHADDNSLQLLDGHLNVTTIAGQGVTLKPVTP